MKTNLSDIRCHRLAKGQFAHNQNRCPEPDSACQLRQILDDKVNVGVVIWVAFFGTWSSKMKDLVMLRDKLKYGAAMLMAASVASAASAQPYSDESDVLDEPVYVEQLFGLNLREMFCETGASLVGLAYPPEAR